MARAKMVLTIWRLHVFPVLLFGALIWQAEPGAAQVDERSEEQLLSWSENFLK